MVLVMHLLTYFFSVHLMLWLCYTLRSLNGGLLDTVRTLTTAKEHEPLAYKLMNGF